MDFQTGELLVATALILQHVRGIDVPVACSTAPRVEHGVERGVEHGVEQQASYH